MTRKKRLTIEDIRSQFFLNPNADKESIARTQAMLSILIGNVFDWYVCGANYQSLKEALNAETEKKLVNIFRERRARAGGWRSDKSAPFVLNPQHDPNSTNFNIGLESSKRTLKEALPIVDEDTVGMVRFNHHFIGEVHPQGNLLSLAASIIATFINENAVVPKVSPSVITWEQEIARWMWRIIYKKTRNAAPPKGCSGLIVSGGTVANLTTLFIAREKFREWCKQRGHDANRMKTVVLVSPHSHYSVIKAARQMGFDRENIVKVKTKDVWIMTGDDVRSAVEEARSRGQQVILVSALAGSPETGFVDELHSISKVISDYNASEKGEWVPLYFHVDAAVGGPFLLLDLKHPSKNVKLFDGIESADAITIDGHKYFYCNYPCGGVFVKNEADFAYLREQADYLFSGKGSEHEWLRELLSRMREEKLYTKKGDLPLGELDKELELPAGFHTLEGSRGTQGVMSLYMILKILNEEGLAVLLQHDLEMSRVLRRMIKESQKNRTGPALELLTDGPLAQTLFRFTYNWRKRSSRINDDNKINHLIPYYLRWSQSMRLDGQKPLNYYVGTDQLTFSGEKLRQFFDDVWELNESGKCPDEEWRNINEWSMKDSTHSLYTLKASIIHPYTDRGTLKEYVDSILKAGKKIGALLYS